jgi:hypothetical protein
METKTLEETVEEMRKYIRIETAGGFATAEEIESSAVEVFSDYQAPEILRPIAQQLTREAVDAHLLAQKGWPAVTDCDLLDRAFGELERAGIVSRQNFTCCGT